MSIALHYQWKHHFFSEARLPVGWRAPSPTDRNFSGDRELFEHMEDALKTIDKASALLSEQGVTAVAVLNLPLGLLPRRFGFRYLPKDIEALKDPLYSWFGNELRTLGESKGFRPCLMKYREIDMGGTFMVYTIALVANDLKSGSYVKK